VCQIPSWAAANVVRIFPNDPEQASYFNAAWHAYLMFCRAYDTVLPTLRPQYALAVERIAPPADAKRRDEHLHRLGGHLLTTGAALCR
jgi:hypothetical protein